MIRSRNIDNATKKFQKTFVGSYGDLRELLQIARIFEFDIVYNVLIRENSSSVTTASCMYNMISNKR